MAATAYTTLATDLGKQYAAQNALSGRTLYAFLYTSKSIAKGDLLTSTLIASMGEPTGTGYARQSVALGSANSQGIWTVPGVTWQPAAAVTDWPANITGFGLASAATSGIAIQLWDHMRASCVKASNTTVTMASTVGLVAGMSVYGVGIPSSTTISSVTNATTIVLSQSATDSATNSLAFSVDLSSAAASTFVSPSVNAFFKNPGDA